MQRSYLVYQLMCEPKTKNLNKEIQFHFFDSTSTLVRAVQVSHGNELKYISRKAHDAECGGAGKFETFIYTEVHNFALGTAQIYFRRASVIYFQM